MRTSISDDAEVPPTTPRARLGMVGKTTITMLLVGLIPLLAFGGYALSREAVAIRDGAERSLQASAGEIAAGVDGWLDQNLRALEAAASLPAVASMKPEAQADVLAAVQRTYPWMYLVFTVGLDGQNVARSDGKPLADYSDRQYYKDVMLGKIPAWETLIGKTSGKPALVLAVPVEVEGRKVGVIAAAMSIEEISRRVAQWRAGRTGYAFLVDERAKVVAHPRAEFVVSQKYLTDHPALSAFFRRDAKPTLLSFGDALGAKALAAVQGNRFHWAIVAQQDEEEVFAPMRRTLSVGLALFGAAAIAVAGAARWSSRRLIRPIVEMTAAADRMSHGELGRPIRVDRVDELGLLAHSLERLRRSLKAAMARLQGAEAGPGSSSIRR